MVEEVIDGILGYSNERKKSRRRRGRRKRRGIAFSKPRTRSSIYLPQRTYPIVSNTAAASAAQRFYLFFFSSLFRFHNPRALNWPASQLYVFKGFYYCPGRGCFWHRYFLLYGSSQFFVHLLSPLPCFSPFSLPASSFHRFHVLQLLLPSSTNESRFFHREEIPLRTDDFLSKPSSKPLNQSGNSR